MSPTFVILSALLLAAVPAVDAKPKNHNWSLESSDYTCLEKSRSKIDEREAGAPALPEYTLEKKNNIPSGKPFVLHTAAGDSTVICNNAFAAGAQWRRIWLRSLFASGSQGVDDSMMARIMDRINSNDPAKLKPSHLVADYKSVRLYRTPTYLPRFIIVRSPYSRLLAIYMEKYSMHAGVCDGVGCHEEDVLGVGAQRLAGEFSFGDFVKEIGKQVMEDQHMSHHVRPMTMQCGISEGLEYDYHLKHEEEDTWFLDFVQVIGVSDVVVLDGWNSQGNAIEKDCSILPNWASACAEVKALLDNNVHGHCPANLAVQPYGRETFSTDPSEHVERYYTPEIAAVITKIYGDDLKYFNYPEYSGTGPYTGKW